MRNKPLNSSDQSKILIFTLLLIPSVVFGFGIIPAIFLVFGIFMMKRNEDFSHIEIAVRNFKSCALLLIVGGIILGFYVRAIDTPDNYSDYLKSYIRSDDFLALFAFLAMAFTYLILINILFLEPLKSHSKWVEINGIFSTKPKYSKTQSEESGVNIVKGEDLSSHSVADELSKWAKLKEDGHISEEEYNDARQKLLKR